MFWVVKFVVVISIIERHKAKNPLDGSIKIRATHKVVAPGAAQLAFLIVQFMAASGTPAPVFACHTAGCALLLHRRLRKGTGVVFRFLVIGQVEIISFRPRISKASTTITGISAQIISGH